MPQMKKMTKSECTWNRLLCPFSHSFVIRHSCFVIFLIHVALVTLVAFELLDVLIGLINGFTALLLHDFSQRRIDILRHSLRVAAHEKVGALGVEPFPNLSGIVLHPMLDINFPGLIARPSAIEPCEKPFFLECLEFLAVGKIALLMLRSEKQPVLSLCSVPWRSCRYARNGATPVPGTIMIIGTSGS